MIAPSRANLVPDPNTDPLQAIFYSFQESDAVPITSNLRKGVIIVRNPLLEIRALRDIPSQVVDTELDLLNTAVDLVLDIDPDVIAGWEVQNSSWGYLGARGQQYGVWPRKLHRTTTLTRNCRSRHWGADISCSRTRTFNHHRSMEYTTHVDISSSGTARPELVENHANGAGVEYVYSRKHRFSLAPSTVCGMVLTSRAPLLTFD